MTNRDDIWNELKDLKSSLVGIDPKECYSVPAGYFDQFIAVMLSRIRAEEAANARDEIAILSPLLSQAKTNPYEVPAGYFESLESRLIDKIMLAEIDSASEELRELSPLLAGIRKLPTYEVPAGYFDKAVQVKKVGSEKAKVVSMTGVKWIRYAAAAVVVGVVATLAFIYLGTGNSNSVDPAEKSYAWVKKNMKKVSTDDITEFVELAGAGAVDIVKAGTKDEIMTSLLKDVSDKEIQEFLNDTQDAQPDAAIDELLN